MPAPNMSSPGIPVACFAPSLTDEKLACYRELCEGCTDPEVKDSLENMLACVEKWWELPESKRKDVRRWVILHQGKPAEYVETPLEEAHVKELWDVTPWMRELNTLSTARADGILDALPNGELRDAAFSLLWHCKELTLDREPLTQDRLPT